MAVDGKHGGSDPTGALVVVGRADRPVYEAKWRRAGRQVKRRVGPAWLERAANDSGWVTRRGRLAEGYFDEKRATVRMAELIAEHDEKELAIETGERERRERGVAFRELAAEGLEHLQHERGAKPSTLSDYRYTLAEPGAPHRRGKGKSPGVLMAAFGDRPAANITTPDVSAFLRKLDGQGSPPARLTSTARCSRRSSATPAAWTRTGCRRTPWRARQSTANRLRRCSTSTSPRRSRRSPRTHRTASCSGSPPTPACASAS